MLGLLKKLDQIIKGSTEKILVVIVLVMLLLSVAVIVLRWINLSFMWIEPLVRHLVFLSAFLGGVLATGRGTHIGIDIVGKYLETKDLRDASLWIGALISFICFVTLFWLVKSSAEFVAVEAKYGKEVFLGIHAKFLVAIIPFGFSLIGLRFLFRFIFFLSGKDELIKGQA